MLWEQIPHSLICLTRSTTDLAHSFHTPILRFVTVYPGFEESGMLCQSINSICLSGNFDLFAVEFHLANYPNCADLAELSDLQTSYCDFPDYWRLRKRFVVQYSIHCEPVET